MGATAFCVAWAHWFNEIAASAHLGFRIVRAGGRPASSDIYQCAITVLDKHTGMLRNGAPRIFQSAVRLFGFAKGGHA